MFKIGFNYRIFIVEEGFQVYIYDRVWVSFKGIDVSCFFWDLEFGEILRRVEVFGQEVGRFNFVIKVLRV